MIRITNPPRARPWLRLWQWLVNDERAFGELDEASRAQFDWMRVVPFVAIHLACLAVFAVGVSTVAVTVAVGLYILRMFFITGFFHRYFSHHAFRASRLMQFTMALLGCTAGQRGPLWWAAHHREHHIASDTDRDPHSPARRGFVYSHTLWFLTRGSFATPAHRVRDWLRYPELRWLERFDCRKSRDAPANADRDRCRRRCGARGDARPTTMDPFDRLCSRAVPLQTAWIARREKHDARNIGERSR